MYGDGKVYKDRGEIYYVALFFCGLCVVVFGIQQFLGMTDVFISTPAKFSEPWRLVTSLFAHANMAHLLSNLFALGLFGSILEGRIGSRRIFLLFMVTGLLVNVVSPYERSLGASGAIFGLLGALIVLRPWLVVWVGGIPMPMLIAGGVWLISDISGMFLPDDIANLAHIAGLGIGIAAGFVLKRDFGDRPERKDREEEHAKKEVDTKLRQWEKEYMENQ